MRRDWLNVAGLWAILTVLGEVVVFRWSMFSPGYAREAAIVDDAYLLLLAFAVPVFTFMVAMLVYSGIRFRTKEQPAEDGPPMKGSPSVVATWLALTSILTLIILINPGFVGLASLRGEQTADLVIEVEGQRWFWTVTYPNGGVSLDELVLPVDTRVRFDVTSVDVLHSFWVPAFRTKIDAVPGRTTELFVTPDRIGTMDDDSNLRAQCAELCGLGHAIMSMPVRVVEKAEFEFWMDELVGEASAAGEGG